MADAGSGAGGGACGCSVKNIEEKAFRPLDTPAGQTPRADEVKIRTTAVYTGTPIMTTMSGARAAALGIAALKRQGYAVKTLQEYH